MIITRIKYINELEYRIVANKRCIDDWYECNTRVADRCFREYPYSTSPGIRSGIPEPGSFRRLRSWTFQEGDLSRAKPKHRVGELSPRRQKQLVWYAKIDKAHPICSLACHCRHRYSRFTSKISFNKGQDARARARGFIPDFEIAFGNALSISHHCDCSRKSLAVLPLSEDRDAWTRGINVGSTHRGDDKRRHGYLARKVACVHPSDRELG